MIHDRMEACRILGISIQAKQTEWKSAYRNICKRYHPDSINGCVSNGACDYYFQAKEAYEYLESQELKRVPTGNRILGGPITYHNHKENRQKIQKQMELAKQERYMKVVDTANKMKKEEEEKHIIDEIRWIRVAEIIRKTIEEDRKEKEQMENLKDAFLKRKTD